MCDQFSYFCTVLFYSGNGWVTIFVKGSLPKPTRAIVVGAYKWVHLFARNAVWYGAN
ncbi:hypothetical protein [Cellulophaga fucicola]|uniref:hypothetical protein n=1 Tax=Cellulophaga fucicola TaxID=76595 RepID=UPI00147C626C|nr:hypothetical protein [Cellulophaga fucicola]